MTTAVPTSVLAVAVLGLLGSYRELGLDQARNAWAGTARLARGARVPEVLVAAGDGAVRAVTTFWWAALPAGILVATLVGVTITALALARPLRTVRAVLPIDLAGRLAATGGAPVDPLPLRLEDVALPSGRRVTLDLDAGRFVVVTGANGAGKSTLGRVVAGQRAGDGTVQRPGDAGLGRPGGTAMIFQRPESQVLGVRVADDLRWGLPPATSVPVDDLLDRVGLAGYGERETATLSGGELQRLAVAALLARHPAVVVSDESTAMLDLRGREDVAALLAGLARDGMAVVHITHHATEGADDMVALTDPGDTAPTPGAGWGPPRPPVGGELRLRGVDIVHDPGTPWRRPVLTGIDLTVPAGRTLVITGANGSGKTSLAWVLAGLTTPTRGTATLDGEPLRNGRSGVLLGVQHARPALLRATVGEEVADAAGVGPQTADRTMIALGLDPEHYRDRSIDELSGGEQRRVMLAGLLGAGPRVLVLDEPFAGLDAEAAGAVRGALAAALAAGTTLVVVTHDTAPLEGLTDATVHVADGDLTGPSDVVGPPDAVEPSRPDEPRHERRAGSASGSMRTLPGSSSVHRLWAGTKVGALLALAITLVADPSWATLAGTVVVLLAAVVAARVPRRALPRPPRWLLIWVLPAVLATAGVRPPLVEVSGVSLSLGGLEQVVLFLGTTVVSLAGASLLVATTPLADVPPLLQRFARRSRPGGLVPAIALGLRLMPMLLAEGRTTWLLLGQRRHVERVPAGPRERGREGVRAALLACAMAVRRAGETGEAISARGGFGAIARPDRRPGRRDLVAAVLVIVVLGVALAL